MVPGINDIMFITLDGQVAASALGALVRLCIPEAGDGRFKDQLHE
jgi:hypothetical protein